MPMVSTSTPFITSREINVEETDLYDDAWGFSSNFQDVISQLGGVDTSPADRMATQLIRMMSKLQNDQEG
jgi:hypothetical protein